MNLGVVNCGQTYGRFSSPRMIWNMMWHGRLAEKKRARTIFDFWLVWAFPPGVLIL